MYNVVTESIAYTQFLGITQHLLNISPPCLWRSKWHSNLRCTYAYIHYVNVVQTHDGEMLEKRLINEVKRLRTRNEQKKPSQFIDSQKWNNRLYIFNLMAVYFRHTYCNQAILPTLNEFFPFSEMWMQLFWTFTKRSSSNPEDNFRMKHSSFL